jgi:uncharacterized protein
VTSALGVSVFHPVADVHGFRTWLAELTASARAAAGFTSATASVDDLPQLDWAVAVIFDTEDQLHTWLDSADRERVLALGAGRGYWSSTTDLVLVGGQAPPPGVNAFRHSVAAGKQHDFVATQLELTQASSAFPGFEGTALFPPQTGGEWISFVRFRTQQQLARWLQSRERDEVLGELRTSLTKEFAPVSSTTPFATTVRTENGTTVMTPDWKSAMVLLLVLYPTVMILSRFLGPVLDYLGAPPWLAMWLSQVTSVSMMTWWLMPWVSRPFARWLDPVDGADRRTSVVGALVIIACYGLTLGLFAAVKYLQYWDFIN